MKTLVLTVIVFPFLFALPHKENNEQAAGAGQQLIYSFQAESIGFNDIQRLYSSDTAAANVPFFQREALQNFEVNFNCTIRITILNNNRADSILSSFEIINAVVDVKNAGVPQPVDALINELEHPVFVKTSAKGLIRSVYIDSAISNVAVNVIKTVVGNFQFVAGEKNQESWKAVEENIDGSYLASYKLLSTGKDSILYFKKNEGYTKLREKKSHQKIVPDNQTRVCTDRKGNIKAINISESQVVLFGADTVSASGSKVQIKLQSEAKTALKDLKAMLALKATLNYANGITLSEGLTEDQMNRLVYRHTLGRDNWQSLQDSLRKVTDVNMEERLIPKFRALAYLYPGTCTRIANVVQPATLYASSEYRIVTYSLMSTRTPEAVNGLVSVLHRKQNNDTVMMDILQILAVASTPTEKAFATVRTIAFDSMRPVEMQRTAQLALGGIAYNFRNANLSKADSITRYLLETMKNETDSIQKILVLANTGSPLVMPLFKQYIEAVDVSAQVKSVAVEGLRLIDHSEVDTILEKELQATDSLLINAAKATILFRNERKANE